nr:7-alpha-hydroxycholest-4-en-3-one 12-alpha-hydroxylase-like isoform X2 [Microcebus murinus]
MKKHVLERTPKVWPLIRRDREKPDAIHQNRGRVIPKAFLRSSWLSSHHKPRMPEPGKHNNVKALLLHSNLGFLASPAVAQVGPNAAWTAPAEGIGKLWQRRGANSANAQSARVVRARLPQLRFQRIPQGSSGPPAEKIPDQHAAPAGRATGMRLRATRAASWAATSKAVGQWARPPRSQWPSVLLDLQLGTGLAVHRSDSGSAYLSAPSPGSYQAPIRHYYYSHFTENVCLSGRHRGSVAMVLWSLALGALLLVTVLYLCLPGLLRQRGPQEPPLDKGTVPWLGHAMAFRKNMFGFLKRMWTKHGDVFTVQLAGQYFTFVMDPLSFGPILKETQRKPHPKFENGLVQKVFGYYAEGKNKQKIHLASQKYLMGHDLEDLNEVVVDTLSLIMLGPKGRSLDASGWREDGLFHFCYNTTFKAGYLSLFGHTKDKEQDLRQAEQLFTHFLRFDHFFPRCVYSLLGPREWLEMGRLQRFFPKMLSAKHNQEKGHVSKWLCCMRQFLREHGAAPDMQDRFSFMTLWASQANKGPAAFWALLFLLKHPEAMQAVKEEASQVLGGARLAAGQSFPLQRGALRCTPVLDSVMEETLRLRAAPTLCRAVSEDCMLKTASGKEYLCRRGDIVALFPYLSVHMDPDIHPEPTAFKYDRFLNPDGSRKVDFYKAGKKIPHYTMSWGSGLSMCPGRFFALSEMKLFVLLMVTHFDLELVDPYMPVPQVDPTRWGFGVMHPNHDVRFRYRLQPAE